MSDGEEGRKYCMDCKYYGQKIGYGEIHPTVQIEKKREWCYLINDELSNITACSDFEPASQQENPAVLGFRKRKEAEDRKFRLMQLTQVFIVLVLLGTGYIALETQEIVKESAIPNYPALMIYPVAEAKNLVFWAGHLVDRDHKEPYMTICIENYGRSATGPLNVNWNEFYNPEFPVYESHQYIPPIVGASRSCFDMAISSSKYFEYYKGNVPPLNHDFIQEVPVREFDLQLVVKCHLCPPGGVVKTQEFKICIWGNDSLICKDFSY